MNLLKVIFISSLYLGCTSVQKKSILINTGDPKAQVIKIMGQPENRQIKENKEAWQYCNTTFGHYNFSIIWFANDTVIGTNTYGKMGAPFSGCDNHFDPIKWEDDPNSVIESRNK